MYKNFLLNNLPFLRDHLAPVQPDVGPPIPAQITDPRLIRRAIGNTPVEQPRPRVIAPPVGGPQPQSQMSNGQLNAQGPGYGSQAARVADAQPSFLDDPLYQQLVSAGAQPLDAIKLVVADRASKEQQAKADAAKAALAASPVTDPLVSAISAPGDTAESITGKFGNIVSNGVSNILNTPILTGMGPGGRGTGSTLTLNEVDPQEIVKQTLEGGIQAATNAPVVGPVVAKGLEYTNRLQQWNAKNAGEHAYNLSIGKDDASLATTLDFTNKLVEPWASGLTPNPDGTKDTPEERSAKIKAAYEVGLDLNKDGVIDVKGPDAVMMYYYADTSPGFLDNMISQLAFDPLFYGSFVGPVASSVREGVQAAGAIERTVAGVERAAGTLEGASRTERVLKAVDSALGVAQTGGELVNKVQDLPFTLPVEIARKAGEVIPGLRRGMGWITEPGEAATRTRAVETAEGAGHEALNATDTVPPVERAAVDTPDGPVVNPQEAVVPADAASSDPVNIGTESNVNPSGVAIPEPKSGGVGGSLEDVVVAPAVTPGGSRVIYIGRSTEDMPVRIFENKDGTFHVETRTPDWANVTGKSDGWKIPSDIGAAIGATDPNDLMGFARMKLDYIDQFRIQESARYAKERPGKVADFTVSLDKNIRDGIDYWNQLHPDEGYLNYPDATDTTGVLSKEPTPVETTASIDTTIPVDPIDTPLDTTLDTPEQVAARDARNAAIKAKEVVITDPVPGGSRLIDKAADRGAIDPEAGAEFAQRYAPIKLKRDAELAAEDAQTLAVNTELDAAKAEVAAKKAASGGKFVPSPRLEKAYDDFREMTHDQVLAGIEHVVNEVAPAYRDTFYELPEIAPSSAPSRIPAGTDPAGNQLHRAATVKEENLPYLYQRYVYEDSEKNAAKIMETLRTRTSTKDVALHPETLQQLADLRAQLNELKQSVPVETSIAPTAAALEQPPLDFGAKSIDEQVLRGDLSPESADFLKQAHATYRARVTKDGKLSSRATWKTVTPEQYDALITANPGSKLLERQEQTAADILEGVVKANPDATNGEIAQIYGNVMAAKQVPVPPKVEVNKVIAAMKKGGRMYASSARSIAVNNAVTGFRGFFQDTASDFLRLVPEGHLAAGMQTLNPAEFWRSLRGGSSEAEQLLDHYGMKPIAVHHSRGKTEVETKSRTATNELVSGALMRKEGSAADKAIGWGTEVIDSRAVAKLRGTHDDIARQGVIVNYIRMHEGKMVRGFTERARTLADANDILPSSVNAYLADMEKMDPAAVRESMHELATDAGLSPESAETFAHKLAEDWRHTTGQVRNKANEEQRRILFTYERTKLDEKIGGVIFYHYWMTRAIPAYARIALRNPEILAAWVRGWNDMKNRAQKDGLSPSLQNMIKLYGDTTGWYGAWSPWNVILPLADLLPQSSGNPTEFDKLTQFFALAPQIRVAASVIGLSKDSADPFNLYSVRNMALAITNKIRAETGRPPILADEYGKLVAQGIQLANDIVSQVPIPGFEHRAFQNPEVYAQAELNYVMAQKVAEQTGVPIDQWVPGDANFQIWQQAYADGQAGIDNPIYTSAYEEWADEKLKGRVLNSLIPGGVRTRYGPKDELQAGDLTDQQYDVKGMLNSGSPEDANLDILRDQYKAIGTPRQQALWGTYTDIVHPENLEWSVGLEIGGKFYLASQLQTMDESDRKVLANHWLDEQNGTDEFTDYKAKRKTFIDTHPEYGSYADWQSNAYGYKDGGLRKFREDRAAGNPNFKKQMNEQRDYLLNVKKIDPRTAEDELDAWAASLDGYKAAHGIQSNLYDQKPISTGDQATVDSIVSMVGSGGGGSGSGSTSTKKDYATKLKDDITKYDTDMAAVTAIAKDYNIDLTSHNPYAIQLREQLFGDLLPSETTLMRQFSKWAAIQRTAGADDSVEAFGKYMDDLALKQAA